MSAAGPPPVDARLVGPAVVLWLATWWAVGGGWWRGVAAAAAAGVVALALAARRHAAWVVLAGCLAAAAGGLVGSLVVARAHAGPLPRLALEQAAVRVVLTIRDDPRASTRAAGPVARRTVVVRARVDRLHARGQDWALRQQLTVFSSSDGWLGLLPGTRVAAEGRLLVGRDNGPALSARGPPRVLAAAPVWQRAAGRARAGLRAAVDGRGSDVEGLLPGVVLGDTSALTEELREQSRTTGLTHLTAVSGFNVAIVLGAVLLLARWCRLSPRAQAAVGLVSVAFFVVLARPSPSVVRAGAMAAVALLALALGRPRAAIPALSGSVVALLLVDPRLARSYGFVLSVLATAALLTLAPRWSRVLARWLPQWLADALAVPAAAHVVTAPVVAMISGAVSLVAVPANLLADPAVAPATLIGLLAAAVSPVSPGIAGALAWVAAWPTRWIAAVARHGAELPSAAIGVPDGRVGLVVVLLGTGMAVLLLRSPTGRRNAVVAAVVLVAGRTATGVVLPSWPPAGWQLVVCDVGQGDALALASGPGHAVVVDAGGDPAPVRRCLDRLRVRAVDVLVLTHWHADHVLGVAGVLAGRRVGAVWAGPLTEPEPIARVALARLHGAGLSPQPAVPGTVLSLPGLRLEVLAPDHAFRGTRSDPNNSSVVLRARFAGFTALLTGDVEPEAQAELLRRVDVRADVLKVPHHGSSYQLPALLDAVGARIAVASVGADNDYGHPAAATLDRLIGDGALVLRTDRNGSVAILADGHGLRAVPARGAAAPTPLAVLRDHDVLTRARRRRPASRGDNVMIARGQGRRGARRGRRC